MQRAQVLGLAFLAAVGLAVIPSVLPAAPNASFDAIAQLELGHIWVAFAVIFLGGLFTAFTPCVYPLIPITVGVFGARQTDSRSRALLLTSAYVVGMGIVFSALGILAALSGKAFGFMLGNDFIVVGLAVFLTVLACAMFGAFELALPAGIAAKLNKVGGGGVLGALMMGSVAGFVAAPCTGPVLTGVLTWVSSTRDPILGAALLFTYALGIGVPFFLIGVFTVRLPKGGTWMEWVKSAFGIALLALAVTYLRDGFPSFGNFVNTVAAALGKTATLTLAAVFAFMGVAIGAVHLSFKTGRQWFPKSLGITALLMAFLIRMASPTSTGLQWDFVLHASEADFADVFEQALAQAKDNCSPVMVDFFAEWCAACKELDQHTYVAKEVVEESQRFVKIKVDGTEDNEILDSLYEHFGIQGLPTVAFVDPMGRILDSPRVAGFLPPEKFAKEMKNVAIVTSCLTSP